MKCRKKERASGSIKIPLHDASFHQEGWCRALRAALQQRVTYLSSSPPNQRQPTDSQQQQRPRFGSVANRVIILLPEGLSLLKITSAVTAERCRVVWTLQLRAKLALL